MAFEARRFTGEPLKQPCYNFRDVPWCSRDLAGSTLSVVTERKHLVDSIAEMTLLCNEAARRRRLEQSSSEFAPPPATAKSTKPLSIEYIFDRIDTDDPIWGLMVRTDVLTSLRGRTSNAKCSPMWRRGMLQGFITMTTFTNWQSTFRFDSLNVAAFGSDDDALEEQMSKGLRRYDADGSLAEAMEATIKGGNPHLEGIVYPRIAEVSLFGGLGCGKQLLRLLLEHLECMKATASQNYDFLILQATENSIPFYESMGFIRVGCVQGKAASPDAYVSNPVFEYFTAKNGETPSSIAREFGVDVLDVVFLNRPLHGGDLVQKSWLKSGTKMFVPKVEQPPGGVATAAAVTTTKPKWYSAEENETPRGIAKKFGVDFAELLRANKRRYPDLVGHSKLLGGTRVQISRFHVDEGSDSIAYSHWTFPDTEEEDSDTSYMMAMRLNRKRGLLARERPVADSLAVTIQPYDPDSCGVTDLLLQPQKAQVPLAPVFTKKPTLNEPQKPKRPVTSYAHFTVDVRAKMEGKLEGMPFVEVNKILSEKWRAMSDEDKVPYQEKYEKSKAEYMEAMKKYDAEMARFQREGPGVTANSENEEINLLEKVVKLRSKDGILGASKFEYYYVLTFIKDLHWVHLIPMRKNGIFGPECPDACGRPIWGIVGEDEGKEIDATASLCLPVTAITMRNSADADEEQWDIYDNGEVPPPPRPVPTKPKTVAAAAEKLPDGHPIKPKKPATSFAFFCADAKNVMNDQLENKTMAERTKVIAERWNAMNKDAKQKYKDQQVMAHEKYALLLKQYKKDLEKFERQNPGVDISSKAPKSSKKTNATSTSMIEPFKKIKVVSTPATVTKRTMSGQLGKSNKNPALKRGRGRPRKNPLPDDISAVVSKKMPDLQAVKKDQSGLEKMLDEIHARKSLKSKTNISEPGDNDMVLSMLNDKYKVSDLVEVTGEREINVLSDLNVIFHFLSVLPSQDIMWNHFKELGKFQKGTENVEMCEQIYQELKMLLGVGGRFFKKRSYSSELFEVDDTVARQKILRDLNRRMESSGKWLDKESLHDTPTTAEARPSLTPTLHARRESSERSRLGDAEMKPELSPSCARKRLAPIFLQNYGKKKKTVPAQCSQDSKEENLLRTSRYPGRKRKQTSFLALGSLDSMGCDDSYVVSDDAGSVDAFVPKKRKVKSNR
ncbi:hypothetical protein ACHAXA_002651 [Cyclostephanos tholiformis]|uniref:Uncharacterized protein n=1 Tax=Cyclostephanos tholiformis TaxID=382380 RepID=A0ABD3SCR2_9STRA